MLRSDFLRSLAALPFVAPLLDLAPPAEEAGEAPPAPAPDMGPHERALYLATMRHREQIGCHPDFFVCSRETFDALWEEVLGSRPTHGDGYEVYMFNHMSWWRDDEIPYGDFSMSWSSRALRERGVETGPFSDLEFEWDDDTPPILRLPHPPGVEGNRTGTHKPWDSTRPHTPHVVGRPRN